MLKKAVLIVLLAGILGPIVASKASLWWQESGIASWGLQPSDQDAMNASIDGTDPPAETLPGLIDPRTALPGDSPRLHALEEVLRFDVTPQWVLDQWPMVSTGLAHLPLHGYRVPLVTGTGEQDLAGALTYYFDSRHQVARITFQGKTGDVRPLVYLATTRYQLTKRRTNDPGHLVFDHRNARDEPTSFLWIRPAGVMDASKPNDRYYVGLSLGAESS